ncbi:DUF1768 domain-containing protein [Meloidogyne graminicola]|uniref:DUF1768 domain-containing protein n=1 Tax=Meloidogyne graminicola TaxID=189291 RepID=A0A8T0A488_9BILA|nr:DUF1768 domain-containing protein [Meloidogyne graminicola]
MSPTKRKANKSSSSSLSRPSSSISSSISPTSSNKISKEKQSPKKSIYKRRGQKFVNDDKQIVEKFKPYSIVKQGELVDLELEGKKIIFILHYLILILVLFAAIAFNDQAIAEKIMQVKTPLTHKRLGKQVTGFDPSIWEPISILSMVIGLMKKFQQNENMKNELLATGEAELIEASPFDAKWGAGKGKNQIIAGESRILMAIRQHLISFKSTNLNTQNSKLNLNNYSPNFSRIVSFSTESELYLANSLINEFGINTK